MADRHTPKQRSYNMSKVRSTNTKPEIKLRKSLFATGFRYTVHNKNLPGKPDIVLKKYKTVIHINGCFWHGHDHCRYFTIPETRTNFWTEKISGTIKRDLINNQKLTELGWHIITVWECELKPKAFEQTLETVISLIRGNI